jgi:hypothetical protein
MVFKYYKSDVEIRKGDRVLFAGKPSEIELVASSLNDEESKWYVEEFGGGIMILEPTLYERVFISADQLDETEDLEFVARADV